MNVENKNSSTHKKVTAYKFISWFFAIIDLGLIGYNIFLIINYYTSQENVDLGDLSGNTILFLSLLIGWNVIFFIFNLIKRKQLEGEFGFTLGKTIGMVLFFLVNGFASLLTISCGVEAEQSTGCDQCFLTLMYILILPLALLLNVIWGLVMAIMAFFKKDQK